jgi:hypothetical protein
VPELIARRIASHDPSRSFAFSASPMSINVSRCQSRGRGDFASSVPASPQGKARSPNSYGECVSAPHEGGG